MSACPEEYKKTWEWLHLAGNTDVSIADVRASDGPVRAVAVSPDGRFAASGGGRDWLSTIGQRDFKVRVWVDSGDYWGVFFDTHEQVKKRFDAEGISIPYPQQDVHMHQVA